MPIIASQHRWKDKEHIAELRADWPEDCYVQWGGSGVVIGGSGGPRRTAFFEAFPKGGGFIRGEGATIREAEDAAHRRFLKETACQHQWGRGTYTNGGCKCKKCGAFQMVMKPIVKLGAWRAPLQSVEFEMAVSMHGLGPSPMRGDDGSKLRRKIWLRLRQAGFDLPPMPEKVEEKSEDGIFDPSPYAQACAGVIFTRLEELGGLDLIEGRGDRDSLSGFFDGMSFSMLKWEYRDWLEKHSAENAGLEP